MSAALDIHRPLFMHLHLHLQKRACIGLLTPVLLPRYLPSTFLAPTPPHTPHPAQLCLALSSWQLGQLHCPSAGNPGTIHLSCDLCRSVSASLVKLRHLCAGNRDIKILRMLVQQVSQPLSSCVSVSTEILFNNAFCSLSLLSAPSATMVHRSHIAAHLHLIVSRLYLPTHLPNTPSSNAWFFSSDVSFCSCMMSAQTPHSHHPVSCSTPKRQAVRERSRKSLKNIFLPMHHAYYYFSHQAVRERSKKSLKTYPYPCTMHIDFRTKSSVSAFLFSFCQSWQGTPKTTRTMENVGASYDANFVPSNFPFDTRLHQLRERTSLFSQKKKKKKKVNRKHVSLKRLIRPLREACVIWHQLHSSTG